VLLTTAVLEAAASEAFCNWEVALVTAAGKGLSLAEPNKSAKVAAIFKSTAKFTQQVMKQAVNKQGTLSVQGKAARESRQKHCSSDQQPNLKGTQ